MIQDLINQAIIIAITTVFGFIFAKYIKPVLDKKIDTEEEKRAYYKSLKLLTIARDIVASKSQDGKKKFTDDLVTAMIDELIQVTGVKGETAERVIKSAINSK